jgi:hypothetical protein
MNDSISWHWISNNHAVAQIAGRQVDLRYSLSGLQNGWNIFIDGIRRAREDNLQTSKVMAQALLQAQLSRSSWVTDVELGV